MFIQFIHVVVLRGLPSLDRKLERFVPKKWKRLLPNLSQTDYRAIDVQYRNKKPLETILLTSCRLQKILINIGDKKSLQTDSNL